jgi:hypothetical protein
MSAAWDRLSPPHSNNTSYVGVELGRAQIAWQLGKRYVQDEPLKWGSAVRPAGGRDAASPHAYKPEGTARP